MGGVCVGVSVYVTQEPPLGFSLCRGVTRGAWATWVLLAGARPGGSKEAALLLLPLLPPRGHAVEFLLGFPEYVLEVRIREVELWGWGTWVQGKGVN